MSQSIFKGLFLMAMATFLYSGTGNAKLSSVDNQDFGSRLKDGSDVAVNNSLSFLPPPMSPYLKGRWDVGVSGGYSNISAGIVDFQGPLASAQFSYAPFDRFGFYLLGFHSFLELEGSGREILVTPFANNVPLDLPEYADFSGTQGDVTQTGIGASLVFDPLAKRYETTGRSMPMHIGLVYDSLKLDGVRTNYELVGGLNNGATGTLTYDGTYNFLMVMTGIQFSAKTGPVRWVPQLMGLFPLGDKPQKGTITGSFGSISGDSEASGNSDANYGRPLGVFGLTVEYIPWGLSANIGASLYRFFLPSIIDGIDSATAFNLSKRFGPKEKKGREITR